DGIRDRTVTGVQTCALPISLAPALVKAFQESKGDAQVRRYLALAIGRLDPPLPPVAVADLTHALDDPDSETRISVIWALGSSGEIGRASCRERGTSRGGVGW